VHHFDLRQAADALQAEPHSPQDGHRTITLYHYGSVTIVLILFETGSRLPEHVAEGLESIHVLDGDVIVTAEGHEYDLAGGSLLVLNPGTRRTIGARSAARLLLTVHLGGEKTLDAARRPEATE
jgi:quercetin dioxygenase-like cupin family protein